MDNKKPLTINDVISLIKQYSNDQDLGAEIRKLINSTK
jgi:hypothetical protein